MKKEGRHIRAAKRQIEPCSARLPEARILKPHPRKGTETKKTTDINYIILHYLKNTSAQVE